MNKFLSCIDHKWFVFWGILLSLLIPSDGCAQTRTNIAGEVINVNPQLQIAFIDIGNKKIGRGDVVEIQAAYEKSVYMQVIEAAGIISKVGFGSVVERNFPSEQRDFSKVKIGDSVVKIDFYDSKQDMRAPAQRLDAGSVANELFKGTETSIDPFRDGSGSYAVIKNKEYPEEQAACAQRVNHLEKKLDVLTEKLKYMRELIKKAASSTAQ